MWCDWSNKRHVCCQRVLLVAPVRKLARHRRIDVRADLRVPGEIDRVADARIRPSSSESSCCERLLFSTAPISADGDWLETRRGLARLCQDNLLIVEPKPFGFDACRLEAQVSSGRRRPTSGETHRGRPLPHLARARARADVRRRTRTCSAGPSTTWPPSGRRSGTSSRCARRRRTRRPRARRDAGRPLVPRRAAELRRAPAGRRRRRSTRRAVSRSQTRDPIELTFASSASRWRGHAPACSGSASARATVVAAYLPNIPETLVAVRRDGESRRDLGELRARARLAQRDRPPGAARADGAARGRRLRLPRRRSIDRREEVATIRAALPTLRARRARAVRRPRARRTRWPGATCSQSRGPLEFEPVAVRPPAVRPLLVGDDRPPEGDRARPRRDPAREPEGARAALGSEAGRAAPLVLDDLLDDVERARRGAARALVDRDARRRPVRSPTSAGSGGSPRSSSRASWESRPRS